VIARGDFSREAQHANHLGKIAPAGARTMERTNADIGAASPKV
jgi:hypothetical protein